MSFNADLLSGSRVIRRLPLRIAAVPSFGNRRIPPSSLPLRTRPPHSDDFIILKIETKQASGEALPADVVANLAPGVQMCFGSRRVMRSTLFDATKTNHTGTLPYCGLVQPAKEDINFLASELHGIQAIYKKADSVNEPMLMDNEIPTVTTVSFRRLMIDHNVVEEQLEQKRRRARELENLRKAKEAELLRKAQPPPPDPIHTYFKRQREENEERETRAEKRARADHTKSNITFYAIGIATGVAVKYLL